MTDQNEVTVQELAQARKNYTDSVDAVAVAESKLEIKIRGLPENELLGAEARDNARLKEKLTDLETKFKAQLIAEYKGSGAEKKKQFDGGSVAVGKKFFYDDAAVIAWLRDHNFGNLITETYKKTDVKPMHKENNPVDGITTEETITPKINTDLSEFLLD